MRIAVCIKQVPAQQSGGVDERTHTVRRDGVAQMMNPADGHALEAALCLREQHGGSVCAITMGPASAEEVLRESARLGADELVLVSDPAMAGSDTFVTARILARVIRAAGQADLILCGRRSCDGETGQTAPQIAVNLSVPYVSNVIHMRAPCARSLLLTRLVDGGEQVLEADLPAVLAVCEGINHVRLPSIAGIRRAKTAPIARLTAADLGMSPGDIGLEGSPTRVRRASPVQYRRRHPQMLWETQSGAQLVADAIHSVRQGKKGMT